MNNEIAPVLDILEELKQECKAISKAQVELRTTIAEQLSNPKGDSIKTQETQNKIKEHQLFVLEVLSRSSKKLDPKFEALQQLIIKQQKPVEYKNYSLFASVQLAERMLLLLVSGLVMVSCWFFGMGANQLQTASDYDLRYRYLRMQGKATASEFAHLDSILLRIEIPKPFSSWSRRSLITSKPCNGKRSYCYNKIRLSKSKEN